MSREFTNEVASSLNKIGRKEGMERTDSMILIIYAGGTIGMVQSEQGYVPATNMFSDALRQNRTFHDQDEHERRLQGQNYSEDFFITPESFYKKRIIFKLIELTPLIDSSNMRKDNWIEIAEVIESNYYSYDGFLVLHGTDTMAYTASMLSFMLENLQKPVILTGSQIPYFEVRNDAAKNLLESLTIAGHFHIPEVCLYFNNKLFRGNRSTKVDNNGFESFATPNYGYLVKSGIGFKVKWTHIRKPRIEGRFSVHKVLEESISILLIFPIITLQTIQSATQAPTKAVIIMSYGAGNIPSLQKEFLQELKAASDRGVVIVNITQCVVGSTSAEYECGKILLSVGVVAGGDMTLECTVTKLSYLLGKYPDQPQLVKKLMGTNLRGEITLPEQNVPFSFTMQNALESICRPLGLSSQADKVQVLEACFTMIAHNSVYDGLVDELRKLAEEGISMELRDREGRTLLHIACTSGDMKIIDFLLSQNVPINPVDFTGNTPLLLAIQKDFIRIAEKLIEKGGLVKGSTDNLAHTLCNAAIMGNTYKVRLLIDARVNLNIRDYQGRTVAHAATLANKIDIIELLQTRTEFNFETKDSLGFTPLMIADKLGLTQICEMLRTEETGIVIYA